MSRGAAGWLAGAALAALTGCQGGSAGLAADVEGYCTRIEARVSGWVADPSAMRRAPDAGAIAREAGFCLRVRGGDDGWSDRSTQALSLHVDALANPSPDDGAHLEAIAALLAEARQRPLKR